MLQRQLYLVIACNIPSPSMTLENVGSFLTFKAEFLSGVEDSDDYDDDEEDDEQRDDDTYYCQHGERV